MSMENNDACGLHDRFSFKDKIIMQTGWNGFMIIGTYGIYKQNPLWALAYVAYIIIGYALIVMPWVCAHCPYPYKLSSCLFMPPGFLRKIYNYRESQPSAAGKLAAGAIMIGTVIIPNFWLFKDTSLLIVFWLFGLPTLLAFPLHYCKKCRHLECPANRVKP